MTQGNRRGSSVGGIRGSAILMTVRSGAVKRRVRAWRPWARALGVMALAWLLTVAPFIDRPTGAVPDLQKHVGASGWRSGGDLDHERGLGERLDVHFEEWAGGGGFVLVEGPEGGWTCREATPDEVEWMRQRDPTLPLHVITPLKVSQQRTGLRIILRATPQLEQFPQAKAAFLRAAQTWERWIRNPITIVLDVDFGPTRFGQPYPPRVIGSTRSQELIGNVYPDVRSLLLQGASSPQERNVYTALPQEQVPTDLEETSTSTIAAPSAVLRAIGAISPVANPDGERVRFGDPPSIGFNSNIPFDFTPEDGIDPDKIDFDATVVHEIGHALGFTSLVGLRELIPQVPVAVSVLDLFRFRPGVTLATFSTAQRILSSGGEHIFFAGPPALPLSTGRPDGSGGDGQQASHWKDDALTGQYIGIMDPTAQLGQRMVLTENDVRAFDFLGYWVERFTVNTTEDTVDVNPGDGICADSSGNCSLRAAIMEANTLPAAAIVLQSGQTYTLSLDNRATPGDGPTADEDDLDIRSEIIIQGNGATIQRDPTLRCHLNA
jgi:CSLREA domain-containing protein